MLSQSVARFFFDQHDVGGHKSTVMVMKVAPHMTKFLSSNNLKWGILQNIGVSIAQKLEQQITELPTENRVAGKGESACDIPEDAATLFSVSAQDTNAGMLLFKPCTWLTLA